MPAGYFNSCASPEISLAYGIVIPLDQIDLVQYL